MPPLGEGGMGVLRPEPTGLAARVRLLARRETLFAPGEGAVVMVSGGQDSLALFHLLVSGYLAGEAPAWLHALHVNYQLRGRESEADEALVRSYCEAWNVPLEVRQTPLVKGSGNLQERARELRREAAGQLAGRLGAARVVLGHTLDDQVETLLYRLGRYGGLRALAGMRPLEGIWARPLLESRRAETAAYCRVHGLTFAQDRGNLDPAYARTLIRGEVLPAWEAALPGAAVAAGRASQVATEAVALLEKVLDRLEEEVGGRTEPSGVVFWSSARLLLLDAPERRALLYRLLSRLEGVEAERALVLGVESLLGKGGSSRLDLGSGWAAEHVYGILRFVPKVSSWALAGEQTVKPQAPPEAVPLSLPGRARWGALTITAEFAPGFRAPDIGREAYLDSRAVTGPLTVRSFRPGDRLQPLGAPGTRKLKDFFIDLRVPAWERSAVPLVVCGERILWVGGYALAEEGRISEDTDRVVRLAIGEGVAAEDEDPYRIW